MQFPRRFSDTRDIEIAALLTSSIAWGNRKMICRNCNRLLEILDNQPYHFVMSGDGDSMPDGNIHRTFFTGNLRHYLRGLRLIYTRYGSLEGLAKHLNIADSPLPAWSLAEGINACLSEANDGRTDNRCLPLNLRNTALKRLNMALRWLVRNDGIVDLGIWRVIKPAQLYIPMDVHVSNVSRQLGLLTRKQTDKRAAIDLTDTLRTLRPDDPVFYDYALFGIGIEAKNNS